MRSGIKHLSSACRKIVHSLLPVYRIIFLLLVLIVSVFTISFINTSGKDTTAGISESGTKRWYRGNTHTHARFSDTNDTNDIPEIAGWYKNAGYDFLLLSEHNSRLSKKKVFCHDEAADMSEFLMLCGLELSKSRHHTALGINRYIGDETSLQDGVNKTIGAGGLAILNHPQAPVVTTSAFIKTIGLNHLEVFNGNRPGQTPASEKLWDSILSAPDGRLVYGVASDDNHYKKANVGRGWIMVESPSLTKEDIVENIRKGNFYASTGIILKDYQVTENSIKIVSENGSLITFIGRNGLVMNTVNSPIASYQIKGNESYIRVKITNDAGKMAWTQPVLIK
jgi:hypothetical protein